MRFKSQILSQASGSVAGSTYTRNRYGMVIRQKALPINRNTDLQATVRSFFRLVSHSWTTISAAARQAWTDFAAIVTVPDKKLGGRLTLTANAMYLRNNAPILSFNSTPAALAGAGAGLIPVTSAAPVDLTLPSFDAPVVTLTPSTSACSINTGANDGWAQNGNGNGGLLVQVSPPLPPGVNFYKGPYRTVDAILPDGTNPTSMNLGTANGPSGSKRAFRFVAIECNTATHAPRVSEPNEQVVAVP